MLAFTVFDCSDEKAKCIEKLVLDYGRERPVAEHGGLASPPARLPGAYPYGRTDLHVSPPEG